MGQKRSKGNTNRKSSKSGTDPKNLEIGLESIKPGGVISVLVVASAWPKVTWQFRPGTYVVYSQYIDIYIYIYSKDSRPNQRCQDAQYLRAVPRLCSFFLSKIHVHTPCLLPFSLSFYPCFPSTIVSYLYRPFQFRETRNWGGIGANHLSIVRLGEIVITRDFREVKSHVGNGWLYDKRNRAIQCREGLFVVHNFWKIGKVKIILVDNCSFF